MGNETFENIVGTEQNAGNQHFVLFPQCLLALTRYQTMPHFDTLKMYIAVENIVGKGTSSFSFSHNVFYPIWY